MKKTLKTYAGKKYVKTSMFNELYVGGGSPSVLANEQIAEILQCSRENFNFSGDRSTKFTACTNNLSEEKIRFLASEKVDQLDIGIQTFDDGLRKMLVLRDGCRSAVQKLKEAKKQGLHVSIDLLYNLPSQTLRQWREDLDRALELDPESVDCYPVDIYPGTALAKRIAAGEIPPVGDSAKELEMYLEAYNIFKENGYSPTCHNRFSRLKEDFGKPSSEIVGTGAGFFMGRIGSFPYSDMEGVLDYIAAVNRGVLPIAKLSKLSKDEEMREAMMLIYIRIPVDREEFHARFGRFPEEAFPEAIGRLLQKGLIEVSGNRIRLTEKGDPWRFNVAWEFFKDIRQ
jgi:oxygen-independent coproporphyrinogen-3 oxidase